MQQVATGEALVQLSYNTEAENGCKSANWSNWLSVLLVTSVQMQTMYIVRKTRLSNGYYASLVFGR